MALTRRIQKTVKARAERKPEFRVALLQEAAEAFLRGEIDVGKILLRDYVNATVGFQDLGDAVKKSPKSLMRMLSSEGNPRADSLFAVIAHLQKTEGMALSVSPDRVR